MSSAAIATGALRVNVNKRLKWQVSLVSQYIIVQLSQGKRSLNCILTELKLTDNILEMPFKKN